MVLGMRSGIIVVLLGVLSLCVTAQAEQGETVTKEKPSLEDAFLEGSPWINFRYRYEYADQAGKSENAGASTLRSRLGLKTKKFYGFQGLFEIEDVSEIGSDQYNNTINGRTDFPVVADVEGTEINRAHITFSELPFKNTEVSWGRRMLILDDARFIGDIGWRQNNQTFDSALLKSKLFEDLTLTYSYIHNVNRIFGDDSPVGDLDSQVHIAHLHFSKYAEAKMSAYGYFLEFDNAAALSSNTFGGLIHGKVGLTDKVSFIHKAELAYQEDAGDNPTSYDALYYRVEPGLSAFGITAKVGWEVLGSDDGNIGFSTPLATAHKFNGFADLFLATPDTGLQDLYFWLGYTTPDIMPSAGLGAMKIFGVYHQFEADSGPLDYGTEWDVNFVQNILDNYYFGVKYGNYNAKDFGTDLERIIFSFGANFS